MKTRLEFVDPTDIQPPRRGRTRTSRGPQRRAWRQQHGSAAIVVIAMLAIILIYVGANLRTLDHLHRGIKLVEQRQVRRLERLSMPTNSAPAQTNAPVQPASP